MQIHIFIKPNSKHREEVVKNDDVNFTVFTKAPATEGKANKEAARLLANYFGVSKSQVVLVRGQASKYKLFEVEEAFADGA